MSNLRWRLMVAAENLYGRTLGHEGFEEDVDYYASLCESCGYSDDSIRRIIRSAHEDAE